MSRLLIIGYVWPEPNSSAAGARMMQLIEFFRERNYKITYATSARRSENMADLETLGVTSREIQPNNDEFDVFVQELDPQIVLFDRFMMEEQFGWRIDKFCPDALKILDTEDLHSLRNVRETILKSGQEFDDVYLEADITKREAAAIYRCDISLIISEFEMKLLIEKLKIPEHILFYLPFMMETVSSQNNSYTDRRDFISIGNFLHEPNWRAVLNLKENIWPLLSKLVPDAQLHIYGAYPSQKAWNLHNKAERFIVHGRAENALKVMSDARVCLAPIQFGAGLKGKLAEAMACGTPSVTTKIGSEGMAGDLEWNGFIKDDPAQFVESAKMLYIDEQLWNKKSEQGPKILKERFNLDIHQARFDRKLNNTLKQLPQHRKENFTGLMMKHHLQRSTYFMSRFIQMKNSIN
ncbi:glycosyltransferase family 4 protein [uncultured Christiangramia sp.]|uniref:glycosyltransferase family 4 protein n=1 Tax=uncultured Christiangramia sp. TaxID=503836 RepID=UPI002631B5C0|nr:glycosyltransferase family 4 protein [uncultured Christiangramia sp.]